ncbi:MarR family winged helix-turn-helix transcriptional regulator [Streptomyces sp. NPDC002851]
MTHADSDGQPSAARTPELDAEAEEVAVAVMAASRLLVAISARALAAVDDTLTLPQLRTLVVLDTHGPVKLAALATTLAVNPSTAMRMVDRLQAAGLVDRKANPGNRREVVLNLTHQGQSLVQRVTAHRQEEIRRLVARLPAHERAGLVAALRALTDAADDMDRAPLAGVRRSGGLVDPEDGP